MLRATLIGLMLLVTSTTAHAQVRLNHDTIVGAARGRTQFKSIDFWYRVEAGVPAVRFDVTLPDSTLFSDVNTFCMQGMRRCANDKITLSAFPSEKLRVGDSSLASIIVKLDARATGSTLRFHVKVVRTDSSIVTDTLELVVAKAPIPRMRYAAFAALTLLIAGGIVRARRRSIRRATPVRTH